MFDFDNSIGRSARILSVSGGGLLGVIPAAFLVRYEALGRQAYGADYRLCDSFDTVTGSSTGAVIAAGVALGLSAQDIANFYLNDVPQGFKRRRMSVPLWHDLFDGDLMEGFFERRTRGCLLERRALECDLTILTKDISRGVSVAFTTLDVPNCDVLGAEIRRDAVSLSKILRASTAAPGLFAPVEIELENLGKTTLVDGGFSLFNDPSYMAALMAIGTYGPQIDITVLGTGSSKPVHKSKNIQRGPSIFRTARALFGLIKDGEALTRGLVSELAEVTGGQVAVRRHDMNLTAMVFAQLGFDVCARELREIRLFADFRGKRRLFEAASVLAEQTIHLPLALAKNKHLMSAIDSSDAKGANCAKGESHFHD